MGRFFNEDETAVGAIIAHAGQRHFACQGHILRPPDEQQGHAHRRVGQMRPILYQSAIPIERGAEGAGPCPRGAVLGNVLGRERIGVAALAQHHLAQLPIGGGSQRLVEPRDLEEGGVPAFGHLLGIVAQFLLEGGRVGHIQDDGFADSAGVVDGHPPRHHRPPIVADEVGLGVAKGIEQANGIGREFVEGVIFDALGLVAEVVAPLVGHDDAVAEAHQVGNLVFPTIPELGEAMQEEYWLPIFWPRENNVERNAVGADEFVFEGVACA